MSHPNYIAQFEDRISDLELVSRNIGWGYGEIIGSLAIELEMSIKNY
ncbi:MAG TPA: hypothetical protein VKM36_01500 [Balneolaceae bacterium]|nr:hypothetical protein [Balneolaceae bacterium]